MSPNTLCQRRHKIGILIAEDNRGTVTRNGAWKCQPLVLKTLGFAGRNALPMWVAGVDGCRGGWVGFKVDLTSLDISVHIIDLPFILKNKPDDLATLALDIPIGLLDGSRACDKAARKLLGQPRGTSVFAAPCRASLTAKNHAAASAINRQKTGRGLSQQ